MFRRLFPTLASNASLPATNKEHLIYAMSNQLNQFEQTEPRFVELCISTLLGQPFQFAHQPHDALLNSLAGPIAARAHYLPLLVRYN